VVQVKELLGQKGQEISRRKSKRKMKSVLHAFLILYTKQIVDLNSVTDTSLQNTRLD